MDTEYCTKCGILHDPVDGDCLGCKRVDKIYSIQHRLDIITEAFDTKTRVHDKLAMDYVELKRNIMELEMMEENAQQYALNKKNQLAIAVEALTVYHEYSLNKDKRKTTAGNALLEIEKLEKM